jgi:L-ascorbate metabolism protein UlaG (beta-lactamase superfamily)
MRKKIFAGISLGLALAAGASAAWAQNVKITPLGSHDGELCSSDRAMIFEDPTGVRILYDAGNSVTGGDDVRLGDVHAVLLSHAHGDHMGSRKLKAVGAGTCDQPDTISAAPNSTTAEIAAAKNAAIIMFSTMGAFVAKKIENIRGKPTPNCPETGGALVPPFAATCQALAYFGGTRTIKTANAARGVDITIVQASHDSTVPRELLSDPERSNLAADNTSLSLGLPSGYVIRFTNGLTVYLSGDTGMHTEMKTVVADYHKANLMVLNLGPSAISASSATYVANELVKPAAVIASHVNEGATSGGKLKPGTRTAAFAGMMKTRPLYPALSGRTMEFNGDGRCVAGCQ